MNIMDNIRQIVNYAAEHGESAALKKYRISMKTLVLHRRALINAGNRRHT